MSFFRGGKPEFLNIIYMSLKDRDSSVNIVTSLIAGRQRDYGSIPRRDRDISRQRSDRVWGPTSLLFMGTGGGLISGDKKSRARLLPKL